MLRWASSVLFFLDAHPFPFPGLIRLGVPEELICPNVSLKDISPGSSSTYAWPRSEHFMWAKQWKRKRPKRRNVFNDGHFLSLMCVAIIRRFPSHGLLKRNHVTVKDNLADRSTRSALQEHQPGLTDGYKWFPLPFPSLVSYSCGLSSST